MQDYTEINCDQKRSFNPMVFNLGSRTLEESWTIFGGVGSSYFMYTAVLYLLHSSFRWGSLVYTRVAILGRGTKKVENHSFMWKT